MTRRYCAFHIFSAQSITFPPDETRAGATDWDEVIDFRGGIKNQAEALNLKRVSGLLLTFARYRGSSNSKSSRESASRARFVIIPINSRNETQTKAMARASKSLLKH
jgi:hypothetical protein